VTASTGPLTPLTPREIEVLRLVAQGHSNREIAEQLGRAESTIKNQMSVILDRLRVRDRAHACSLLDDLCPGWRPSLMRPGDAPSLAFRLRMLANEAELTRTG